MSITFFINKTKGMCQNTQKMGVRVDMDDPKNGGIELWAFWRVYYYVSQNFVKTRKKVSTTADYVSA